MARYFTLKELIASNTAAARNVDNTPGFVEVAHLQELVEKILDPLRAAWGKPIIVTSGYRCSRLNTIVGGVPGSAHLRGYAADLIPSNVKIDEFIKFAQDWAIRNHIKFDQIIDERDARGKHWLHVGLYNNSGQQRGQIKQLMK